MDDVKEAIEKAEEKWDCKVQDKKEGKGFLGI